jgi:thiamine-monophosphate kinase
MARAGEFDFIHEKLVPLTGGHPGALGLGDDAALVTPEAGHELVIASDMLVSGVHFLESDTLDVAAYRALASNLSDLAAMGAEPLGYLSSISWPHDHDEHARDQFIAGLAQAQSDLEIRLLGGDTTSTSGELTISITAIGQVPLGAALRRNNAQLGDGVWVSGTIGDAALGLDIARGVLDHQARLLKRYQAPQPQLALGIGLRGLASACIDISDGLMADAGHLARQSKVGLELQAAMMPWSDPVLLWLEKGGEAGLVRLLTAGDDYELLFTAPNEASGEIYALAEDIGITVSWIGTVTEGDAVRLASEDGEFIGIDSPGFTHF